MMDGRRLYPAGWHPQRWRVFPNGESMKDGDPSRTAVGGVRYYLIDFGISSQNQDQVLGVDGQEPSPELSNDVPYDPYKLDVYILGMAYRHFLIEVKPHLLASRCMTNQHEIRGTKAGWTFWFLFSSI